MDQFKKVSRDLFLQKYERYLPTAFDESLTILEKVNKIIEMLIKYGQLSDELIDYLNKFKLEFDDKLKNNVDDIVDKMLNQWLQDGILFDLIDIKYGGMKKDFEQSFFYNEIKMKEYVKTGSGVYLVTTIPSKDDKGNPIYLEKGYAHDKLCDGTVNGLENSLEHAVRHQTSLTVNASIFDMTNNLPHGIHIKDGEVHKNENDKTYYILGYKKESQELVAYPPNTTGNEMIADGVTDAWSGFIPIIQDSETVDQTILNIANGRDEKHPRQVITQMPNKDIKIFTFKGREDDSHGFTYDDMIDVVKSFGVQFAYVLDGGGSTTTVKSNVLINSPGDDKFTELRKVSDFINVIKPTSKAYEDVYLMLAYLSKLIQKNNTVGINKYGDRFPGAMYFDSFTYHQYDRPIYYIDPKGTIIKTLVMNDLNGSNRFYFGHNDVDFTLQSKSQPVIQIDTVNNLMFTMEYGTFTNVETLNGASTFNVRPCQEKRINQWMSILRGGIEVPATVTAGTIIGKLKLVNRPSQNMVVPVTTVGGVKQHNEVIIYTNGDIQLRNIPETSQEKVTIDINCVLMRGE